jgi:hypothetical protein
MAHHEQFVHRRNGWAMDCTLVCAEVINCRMRLKM